MKKEIYHLQAWFSGNVQGVGFRYSTQKIANDFKINGQVKNLPDGRVWLNVEGNQDQTEAFLKEIQLRLKDYIHQTETKTETTPPTLNEGFFIVY